MEHLYPQPTAQGIARTKAIYREKYGKEITDEEALRLLAIIIRFLWLSAHPLLSEKKNEVHVSEANQGSDGQNSTSEEVPEA